MYPLAELKLSRRRPGIQGNKRPLDPDSSFRCIPFHNVIIAPPVTGLLMTGTGYTMAHRMSATLPCDKRGVAAVSNALPHELKMSRQRGVAANAPPAHSRNSMLSACCVDGEPMATRQPGRGRAAGTLFLTCSVSTCSVFSTCSFFEKIQGSPWNILFPVFHCVL